MECPLTGNPLVKTYLANISLLHGVLIADQIRDWCESVIDIETTNVETSRIKIKENHFKVEHGSSLKVSFNTCHDKYDTELEFVNGVIKGSEFLYTCITSK